MTIFSALRSVSYLARDLWPALRRMACPPYDDNPDVYAEHLAALHAEALAQREARTEVLEPQADCGLGEADECLCDPDGGLSCDSCTIDARLAAIHDQLNSAAPEVGE